MRPSERIQQYRKPLLIGMVLFSCIVGGCLFPIVNCNPENPVETSLVMKTIILQELHSQRARYHGCG